MFIILVINEWVFSWTVDNLLIKEIDARLDALMIRNIRFMVTIGMMIGVTMIIAFEIVIIICMVALISKMVAFKTQIAISMMITFNFWLFSSRVVARSMI